MLSPKLVDLLHKAQRSIHLSTLETIYSLFQRYPQQFVESAATFQSEIVKFIDANDIQRSSLAIKCSIQIMNHIPKAQENQRVLEASVELAISPLINGQQIVTNDLLNLFKRAAELQIIEEKTFQRLISQTTLETRTAARISAIVISTYPN